MRGVLLLTMRGVERPIDLTDSFLLDDDFRPEEPLGMIRLLLVLT